jgi:hypothetical protein
MTARLNGLVHFSALHGNADQAVRRSLGQRSKTVRLRNGFENVADAERIRHLQQ